MTRDEAVSRVIAPDAGYDYEHALIDTLVDLGLLKLEERSSPEALLCDVLFAAGLRGLKQREVIDGITSAGLKLVHRSPQENASE